MHYMHYCTVGTLIPTVCTIDALCTIFSPCFSPRVFHRAFFALVSVGVTDIKIYLCVCMQFDSQTKVALVIKLWPNSGTSSSQLFLCFDNRRKIKSRKTRFVGRHPLSRLRRRFAPLRGTQRRCAALRATPPGRYAPRALRAQAFCKHEKNAHFSKRACNGREMDALSRVSALA